MKANLACLLFIQIIACIMHNSVEGVCPVPDYIPPNVNVRPSQSSYNEGDTITYSCNDGYTLRGTERATCTDNEFDPPEVPVCRAKCRGFKYIWDDGKEVTFSCATEAQLQGSPTATCMNGEWVPPKPKCLKICVRPIHFDFDLEISPNQLTYLEGDEITYSCEKGHRLYGATTATCSDTGFFSPQSVPQCEENLECHTGKQTACEPESSECNTYSSSKNNVERTVETCNDDVKLCFIYQFGVQGESVTVNTTISGCVNDLELDYPYGCYNRSILESVDSSVANSLRQLEDSLNTRAGDVQVCFCDRDACNETPETAARNDATAFPFQAKMMLESFLVFFLYWK